MYKSIIFDMDGTLVDSNQLVLDIYQTLTKKYPPMVKLKEIGDEVLLSKSYIEVLKLLYKDPDNLLNEVYSIHQKKVLEHLKLYPNVIDTLEYLKTRGIKLYLFTSELRHIAITELVCLSIYHFFDDIIAFEDVERPKPDPEGLLRLVLNKRLSKHETLFIGNSIIDGEAGLKAGIKTIFMNHHQEDDKAIFFDETFTNIAELRIYVEDYEPAYRFKFDKNGYFNILQLTDLHLMNCDKDIQTRKLINKLIGQTNPDLVVFTGDQVMSPDGISLYQKLGSWMEEKAIPWTLIFGNHDTDYNLSYESIIETFKDFEHLIFKKGNQAFGYGNFFIELRDQRKTKGLIFLMDSHKDEYYMINKKPTWGYGMIKENQLKWMDKVINQYHFSYEPMPLGVLFMHIPPYEFSLVNKDDLETYQGTYEEKPCTPPVKSMLFDYINKTNAIKGIFVGHDHYNDFEFYHDNVRLAYGRVSGYYEYGRSGFEKGGRLIRMHKEGFIKTEIIKIGKGKKQAV